MTHVRLLVAAGLFTAAAILSVALGEYAPAVPDTVAAVAFAMTWRSRR